MFLWSDRGGEGVTHPVVPLPMQLNRTKTITHN